MLQKDAKKSPPKVEPLKKTEKSPNKKHEVEANNFKLAKFKNV